MDKCREEFEQSPKTKELLSDSIYFDEKENRYKVNADGCLISVVFLNGRWEVWQEQQAKVEELQRRNQMLNDNIKEQGQKLVYQNEVIETQAEKLLGLRDEKAELQKRVDAALKETQFALQYVEEDMRGNHEFLQMAMIRTFKDLEQALKGEGQ
ncbi:hypothetical protein ABEV05_05065 [Acinetobacter baumannii]|uniref:hypothetical protein n=1 Tax=Acinetobacter baumannii TaxID=470 RepID=UPI002224A4F4|nr:hypothetical protein [Acinetobacter baumannii]MCW1878218.1 hypothetical protein [Acinetobacter baumannii]